MPEEMVEGSEQVGGLTPEILEEARKSGAGASAATPEKKEPEPEDKDEDLDDDKDEDEDDLDSEDEDEEQDASEDKEDGEGEKPIGLWDKERQARDQEAANERKALAAQIDELKAQMAKASTAAEKKADKSQDSDDVNRADAIADIEKQAMELAESIDENSDAGAISKAVKGGFKKLFDALKSAKQDHGDSSELRELKSKLQGMEQKLAEAETSKAAKDREEADQRALETQDAHIASLDKKYGAALHNSAIKRARAKMDAAGYSEKKRPAVSTSMAFLDAAYAEIALERGVKAAKSSPSDGIRPDSGVGGKTPNASYIKPGTLADVKRQILSRKRS